MQEIDKESVNEQRKRRNRITRMKNMIVMILGGWVFLSMILIIILFILVFNLNKQWKLLQTNEMNHDIQSQSTEFVETNTIEIGTEVNDNLSLHEREDYVPAKPVASGISHEENIASETDEHKVYLTFEDGPSEYTEEILNVLKNKNVKATFFVTGKEEEELLPLYKRIVDEGHTLGMHTYSNKYSSIYQSIEAFQEDYDQLQELLSETTGMKPQYYRFAGGSNNQITNVPMEELIHFLNQEGMVYYDWNISSGDLATNAYQSDEIVESIVSEVLQYKTSIVQLHDGEDAVITAEVVEQLIDELLKINALILPIDRETSVIQSVKANDIE